MRTVKLFATLRDLAGAKTLDIPFERGSVRDLVRAIGEVCPPIAAKMLDEQGQLNGVVHILVNGRNVEWLQGMDTSIEADDDLILIPPAAGG
jgi:molybdopterin synthase sulfur carrier subunit